MNSAISIPRTCDASAAQALLQIEALATLSEPQGCELLHWLQETSFETDCFWIGELAARIIRDYGSNELKSLVMAESRTATEWQLYFFLIALSQEFESESLAALVHAARRSTNPIIAAYADKLWDERATSLPNTSNGDRIFVPTAPTAAPRKKPRTPMV